MKVRAAIAATESRATILGKVVNGAALDSEHAREV